MSVIARDCCFFYGDKKGEHASFSQFYPSSFEDENGVQYTCAEQYMMASKARCMGDEKTLASILQCGYDPRAIKALGRCVKPYDEALWAAVRSAVVARGSWLKFSQNAKLRKILLGTRSLTLVEAAPNDCIWGIGISVKDAAAGGKWRGSNLLGQALMAARSAIENKTEIPAPTFPTRSSSAPASLDPELDGNTDEFSSSVPQ